MCQKIRFDLDLRHFRSLALISLGAYVASAGSVSSSGAAGINTGVWSILLMPALGR
jgi:hypothetical protein